MAKNYIGMVQPKASGRPETRAILLERYLGMHRISSHEAATAITEGLLLRLPPPPEGWSFYELADAGRRSVAGLRVRRGRSAGASFILATSIKQPDGRFKNAQFVLGKWKPDGSGLTLVKARDAATALKAQLRAGIDPRSKPPSPTAEEEEANRPVTLRAAYDLYRAARTGKKRRPLAASTLIEYKRVVEVALRKFVDRPLSDFAGDPRELVKHFNEVGDRTPAEANTQMRVLRALWNRAHKVMPARVPPAPAIWDMNEIEARNAGFVTREVPSLWRAINGLELQIARKAALTLLFLGLREGALLGMQWADINEEERSVVVRTKGAKTLILPLSEIALSILLARTVENDFAADNPFVFPSVRGPRQPTKGGASGASAFRHVDKIDFSSLPPPAAYAAQKGKRARTHPHVFRHTYRTLATASGASEIAIRLLMGHSLQGDVSFDYLTADLDWLRKAQDGIGKYILEASGEKSSFAFPTDAFLDGRRTG
jgi:integrase